MPKIGRDEILEAAQTLAEYKRGKANLDQRIVDNEEWFRLQHWERMRPIDRKRRQTGWLFAAIINKHADFMDNRPECTVLPREKSDEATAKQMTEIMPVLLERAKFLPAYSRIIYDKLKYGAGVYGVYWDPRAENSLGQVCINRVDALNLYWQPGIEHLQESRNLFLLEMVDHDKLIEDYPNIKGLKEKLSNPATITSKYYNAEDIDTSKKSVVVNWYYKREGKLHYCRFVQDIVLFASENEKGYEDGWYADGNYPFVMDVMFPEPGTPHGFGIIDAMRDTQEDIDQLNDLTMANAKVAAKRRYFVRTDANINEDEFRDLNQDIVHFSGNMSDMSIREISSEPYSGTYVSILENKIQELKENSFSRDVNSGGAGQTSTAAGIAASQEAGAKSSRDSIQATYRAFSEVIELVIERIRQFYDAPRIFRITNDDKTVSYQAFSNEGLIGRPIPGLGEDFGMKEPVFDLDIRVNKANAWSRQAQNQDVINFFGMGFFNPQMSTQALACLEVLDIDNKDKLIETIRTNGLREQFIQQYLPILLKMAQMVDPKYAVAAMQAAQAAGLAQAQPMGEAPEPQGDGGVTGQMNRSERYMDKQREISQARTSPQA